MAITQVVIAVGEHIRINNHQFFDWADRGNAAPDLPTGVAESIHYVVWNSLAGPNEVQRCDANHSMIGNTPLTSTSDIVHGSTTVNDLLVWAETRHLQIEEAKTTWHAAGGGLEGTESEGKTWADYDSHSLSLEEEPNRGKS